MSRQPCEGADCAAGLAPPGHQVTGLRRAGRRSAGGSALAAASFEDFYAGTVTGIIRQVYALTGDLAEAQDIAQEAFARAWQRWSSVSTCDSPTAWVRRVATNLAISRWRRIGTAAVGIRKLAITAQVAEVSADNVALVIGLRALPARQRTVLVLYYLADLSVNQVAAELNCSAASVKSTLARGRAALAAAIGDGTADVEPSPEMPHA